jgi:hypothetical protein
MADIPGEDLRALAALRGKFKSFGSKPMAAAPSAANARHEADRRSMLSETDGRRARARGVVRDAQINFKVSSDTKRRIIDVSRELGCSMVDVLERGLELLEEEAKSKGAR